MSSYESYVEREIEAGHPVFYLRRELVGWAFLRATDKERAAAETRRRLDPENLCDRLRVTQNFWEGVWLD